MNTNRRWVNEKQAATHMGVHPRTVRIMKADGRITAYYLGPRIMRYDLNEIDAAFTPKPADAPKAMFGPPNVSYARKA